MKQVICGENSGNQKFILGFSFYAGRFSRICHVVRGIWFRSFWGLRSDGLKWDSLKDCGEWWCGLKDDNLALFTACVWDTIWRWRNEMVHNDRSGSLEDIYADCMRRYSEFQSTHYSSLADINPGLGGEKPHQHLPLDVCCIRVDASVFQEQAGFAAVIFSGSNLENQAVVAPMENMLTAVNFGKVYSVLEGELQGIMLALHLALEAGIQEVRIESDSMAAVNAFQAGFLPFCWDTYPLFCNCLRLCKKFVMVNVSYIPRELNVVADKLAKWARINSVNRSGRIGDVAPFVIPCLL
ncbi:hypothetical protein CsatB_007132 [Cannabis sativa]|uniref:uncharacterized protein LOC115719973 n=1 Tax=Cannabis sativa TaxID=3483 RepID=UPI0011DFBE33|nr:uncharacterized protein LOC115719973 [Cannabis sativa]